MRILILTRHFPPVVTGGARRPYLLARGLARLGADITVLAPVQPPALPDGIAFIAAPHPMPAPATSGLSPQGASLKDWMRANLMLPDPDLRWSLRAAGIAKEKLTTKPDWIFSTSPPESLHLAAARLARHFNCRWAADFRDNWLDDPLIGERRHWARRKAERLLARSLLNKADLLCAPTERIISEMSAYAAHKPAFLLRQPGRMQPAQDEQAFLSDKDAITIVHTGSFSLSHDDRSIDQTLDFFAAALEREPRLRLTLIGRLTEQEQAAARAAPHVETLGVLAMEESWRAQAEADILLLAVAPGSDIVPGKLSEYQAAAKPVICLGGGAWAKALMAGEDPLTAIGKLSDPQARKALADRQSGGAVYAEDAAASLLAEMQRAEENDRT